MFSAKNLTKRFGGVLAVAELDLELSPGKLVGLIGPNGSGKTTVVNLLSGTLAPTSGRVFLNGCDVTGWPPARRARGGIIRTFQLNSLFWHFTVLDNMRVAFYAQRQKGLMWRSVLRHGRSGSESDGFLERAAKILERLGISQLSDQEISGLPAGQQRLVGLAMSLMAEPKFLLLDEPLAGLSWQEAGAVMGTLRSLTSADGGLGMLIIEHNVRSIVNSVDRMVALSFGRKVAEGTATEVVSNEVVVQSYLGDSLK